MSDKPLMTDVRQAFDAVRENATKGSPFQGAAGAAVDGAALVMAQKPRGRMSEVRDLALTWDQWTRLTAILQQEFALAIRHAAFDPPEFPGRRIAMGWRSAAGRAAFLGTDDPA